MRCYSPSLLHHRVFFLLLPGRVRVFGVMFITSIHVYERRCLRYMLGSICPRQECPFFCFFTAFTRVTASTARPIWLVIRNMGAYLSLLPSLSPSLSLPAQPPFLLFHIPAAVHCHNRSYFIPMASQKKASVLSQLSKFVDKEIRVKFNGGREGTCLQLLSKL